jgi:hypothetical protein
MPARPTVDECRERLERVGFRVRELSRHTEAGTAWGVSASRDGRGIAGFGATREEAWLNACREAEALGQLRPG